MSGDLLALILQNVQELVPVLTSGADTCLGHGSWSFESWSGSRFTLAPSYLRL